MASLEVDLANIAPGNTITVKWRGKPVFVKHRTEEEWNKAKDEDISKLRDPETDDARTQKPEVLHPKCVIPEPGAIWCFTHDGTHCMYKGFCHQSVQGP